MKSIQVIGRPAPECTPDLFQLLAGSSSVTETRLYDWSTPQDGSPTVLFEVDGDGDEVQDELVTMPSVRAVDVTPVTANRFTLLAVLELSEIPIVDDILGALIQEGLVVAKPIVYRANQVHAQFVGVRRFSRQQ